MTQENNHTSSINSYIEEYLDFYINLPQSPQFAVLLKGPWGCGKSYFIDNYIKKKKQEGITPIYISLYGLNSTSQIEDALLEQIYSIKFGLNNNAVKIASTIGKGLLKKTLKIDLDGDNDGDGNLSVSISEGQDEKLKLKDSDFCFIVFDDLERCSLKIEIILGYINAFIESQYLKVIIIANEGEVQENFQLKDDEYDQYLKIKEKIIGKTFEVQPDYRSAFDKSIEFLSESKQDNQLEIHREFSTFMTQPSTIQLINHLYLQGEFKNLRTLRSVIFDFERIFEKLPVQLHINNLLLEDILRSLIVFAIEISLGNLKASEIALIAEIIEQVAKFPSENAWKQSLKKKKQNIEYEKKYQYYETLQKKYGLYFIYSERSLILQSIHVQNICPNLKWWSKFFFEGHIDQNDLQNLVKDTRYLTLSDLDLPNWYQLNQFANSDLSDEEFEKLLNKVELEYQETKYNHDLGIIKCLTGVFLHLSEHGLYNNSKKNILKQAKSNVDDYFKNTNQLPMNNFDDHCIVNIDQDKQVEVRFYSATTSEFLELVEYINNCIQPIKSKKALEDARELLVIMENDVEKFDLMINVSHLYLFLRDQNTELNMESLDKSYLDFEIFSYMNPQQFVNVFIYKLDQGKKNKVIQSMKYRFNTMSEFRDQELTFLAEAVSILEQEVQNRKETLSGHLLQFFADEFRNILT